MLSHEWTLSCMLCASESLHNFRIKRSIWASGVTYRWSAVKESPSWSPSQLVSHRGKAEGWWRSGRLSPLLVMVVWVLTLICVTSPLLCCHSTSFPLSLPSFHITHTFMHTPKRQTNTHTYKDLAILEKASVRRSGTFIMHNIHQKEAQRHLQIFFKMLHFDLYQKMSQLSMQN